MFNLGLLVKSILIVAGVTVAGATAYFLYAFLFNPSALTKPLCTAMMSTNAFTGEWDDNSVTARQNRYYTCTCVVSMMFSEVNNKGSNQNLIGNLFKLAVDQSGKNYQYHECGIGSVKPEPKLPPSNLIVAISPSDAQINISWQNNSTEQAVIEIERALDSDNPYFERLDSVLGSYNTYSYSLDKEELISNNHSYRIRAMFNDGSFSDYITTKVSNCVDSSLGGSKRIVLMRGNGLTISPAEYFSVTNSIVNDGFKSIDPFKTYADKFSFSFDLKQIDQSTLPKGSATYYSPKASELISSGSSCGGDAFEYIFLFVDPSQTGREGYTFGVTHPVTYIKGSNTSKFNYMVPSLAIHEAGHAIGGLSDEDVIGDEGSAGGENCIPDTLIKNGWYRNSKDKIQYGAENILGCKYKTISKGEDYHRPSTWSIMNFNYYPEHQKFNVISCGYVVAGILGEKIDKDMAELHWPIVDQENPSRSGCAGMDTNKEGI